MFADMPLTHILGVELAQIRSWLDPSQDYHDACKQRLPGTGRWLLQSFKYLEWLERKTRDTTSFLWIYGTPGSGKTVLSSTIIEDLLRHCTGNPGKAVAYFYIDFNDPEKQNPELMIRSLIFQLLQQSTKVSVKTLSSSYLNIQQRPALDALLELLQRVVEESIQSYVVIDALDECTERAGLISLLMTMVEWRHKKLHILVTSRREVDIEKSLCIFANIGIQSTSVDSDIRSYVHQRSINNRTVHFREDSNLRDDVEKAVTEGAHGMYVLIHFLRSRIRERLIVMIGSAGLWSNWTH